MTWQARVLSLFPDMFPGVLGHSLAGKALKSGIWGLETLDIRDFADDKHRTVDDTPYGGGPGMVMRCDVLGRALDKAREDFDTLPIIYPSPRGEVFSQSLASELAQGPGAIFMCGRFEGVDERILDARPIREVSLGDYVLSGGEPAALVMLDAIIRLLPGVLGASETLDEESFSGVNPELLEYPHYTRPQIWEGREVPEILTSGDHGKIRAWRRARSEEKTRKRRPDLWQRFEATQKVKSPSLGHDEKG